MTPLKSILATTDFSDDANNAVQRAALLAARHQAGLTLLHVLDPSALKGPRAWFNSQSGIDHKVAVAEAALQRLAAEITRREGVQVTPLVLVGHPLEQVCRMADAADLLVIGSKRSNSLRSLIFGAPAEQVLRLVRRPVLMVKQRPQDHYERVLVAVDIEADSDTMLRSASALAPAASLHVLHALSTRRMDRMRAKELAPALIRELGDGERQRGLARLRNRLGALGLSEAQVWVEHGQACSLTLTRQSEIGADLIVLGKDGQSALCHFLLGGVPQRVLSSASCDVLAMPKVEARGRVNLPSGTTWLDLAPRMAFEGGDLAPQTAMAPRGQRQPARLATQL